MTDELTRNLRQLQQYAATLHGLVSDAEAQAPQRSEAKDGTGSVNVVLDAAGLPQEIQVGSDWRRRLEPDALGAAVIQAFGEAARARVAAWSQTLESGEWGQKVGLMMAADRAGAPLPESEVPQLFRRDQEPVWPRPVVELTDEMINAFDNIDTYAGASSQGEEGTNAERTVSVKLSQSALVGCTVDTGWAERQSGDALSSALGEALADARSKFTDQPRPTAALDSLFDEAIALLNNPRRLSES